MWMALSLHTLFHSTNIVLLSFFVQCGLPCHFILDFIKQTLSYYHYLFNVDGLVTSFSISLNKHCLIIIICSMWMALSLHTLFHSTNIGLLSLFVQCGWPCHFILYFIKQTLVYYHYLFNVDGPVTSYSISLNKLVYYHYLFNVDGLVTSYSISLNKHCLIIIICSMWMALPLHTLVHSTNIGLLSLFVQCGWPCHFILYFIQQTLSYYHYLFNVDGPITSFSISLNKHWLIIIICSRWMALSLHSLFH